MFRIGEFSRIAQVSASQLRNYDQLALFAPEKVDAQTGYRFYSASQLPQLNRIIALKEMGLSLAQIKRLVDEGISPAELRGMLTMKKAQIEQTVQDELVRLRYIESRIEQIDQGGNLENYDVVLKSVEARPFLSLRARLPETKAAQKLVQEMRQLLPSRVSKRALGPLAAIMHSDWFSETNLDIELGFLLEGAVEENLTIALPAGEKLRLRNLPAEKNMLTVTRVGHPKMGHGSYSALGSWAQANGYQFSGPLREVYINLAPPDRSHEIVTEIQYPVRPIRRMADAEGKS